MTLAAQEPGPRFEVASVKKRDQSARPAPPKTLPQSAVFHWESATVASLIYFAHNILDFELAGGPDWIRKDLYEINARAAAEASIDERRRMLQLLLEERFRLVLHKEQREMRVSSLVLARDDGRLGPKLTKCGDPGVQSAPILWPRGGTISVLPCAPISAIAGVASRIMRMRVVDKTGLTGMWRHELVFTDPNISVPLVSAAPQGPVVDSNLVQFSTALEEQLGLKLERGRGPVDVLVVDSVQQPSEN